MSRLFSSGNDADRITTGYTTHGVTRTYSIWALFTSSGGGGFGRMCDKRNTGADTEVEVLYLDNNASNYSYFRTYSVSGAGWTCAAGTTNVWHHVCVTYDSSSTLNNAVMYVDGVSQSVTNFSAPVGTVVNNTASYVVGNRGGANTNRGWQGDLAQFCIWNVILNASEVLALARGADPFKIRNASLPYYCRIEGILSPEPGWAGDGTQFSGTVVNTVRDVNPPTREFTEYWPTPVDTAAQAATSRSSMLSLIGVGNF
jgi:hypothetical protein